MSQLLKSRNLTHWFDLLEKADLLDEVDAAQNVTLFVPSKAAMLSPEGELLTDAVSKLDDAKSKASLRDVLRLHLARPAVELDRMKNNQMLPTNLEDTKLRVNLYATVSPTVLEVPTCVYNSNKLSYLRNFLLDSVPERRHHQRHGAVRARGGRQQQGLWRRAARGGQGAAAGRRLRHADGGTAPGPQRAPRHYQGARRAPPPSNTAMAISNSPPPSPPQ